MTKEEISDMTRVALIDRIRSAVKVAHVAAVGTGRMVWIRVHDAVKRQHGNPIMPPNVIFLSQKLDHSFAIQNVHGLTLSAIVAEAWCGEPLLQWERPGRREGQSNNHCLHLRLVQSRLSRPFPQWYAMFTWSPQGIHRALPRAAQSASRGN